MKIYIGSDHAGFDAKEKLFAHLSKLKYDIEDVGDKVLDPNDDYPQFAYAATAKLLGDADPESKAILLCGSGQGMCIAANRVHGIRASLCWDEQSATETREDNDSNVLCLPARVLTQAELERVTEAWLKTPFSGAPRHARRIKEIEELYG
ncbi:MAG TPA: RpiB/LacA/LacB family sugar-phosphate isomerase [Candidatus Saccharimonadales bacterium]|nr:RpiB/LacA/LacB family sugar-phosphate isomerase [Candidatus Saccharimonadales bacterium]